MVLLLCAHAATVVVGGGVAIALAVLHDVPVDDVVVVDAVVVVVEPWSLIEGSGAL